MHPTVDVSVIAAFIVAVIGVAVGGVVDEQVRNPISGNVVTFLRASFDGLKKAEITVVAGHAEAPAEIGRWVFAEVVVQAGIAAADGEKDARHRSLLRKTARGRIPIAGL